MTTFSCTNNTITLSGIFDFGTVSQVETRGISTIKTTKDELLVVDLSGVTEGDSSLLAMMISWKRQSRLKGVTIEFKNGSKSLLQLARLCGVDGLLSITQKPDN